MAATALIAGVLLIAVGAWGYTSQPPEKMSPTALIPAAFGIGIGFCGLLALKDGLRKHAMHFAAMLSLLGMLGAPYPILKRLGKGDAVDFASPAVLSASLTTVICAIFLVLCIRSFVQVRKARKLREATPLT